MSFPSYYTHSVLRCLIEDTYAGQSTKDCICYIMYQDEDVYKKDRDYLFSHFDEIDREMREYNIFEWNLLCSILKSPGVLSTFEEIREKVNLSSSSVMSLIYSCRKSLLPVFDQSLHPGKHFSPIYLNKDDSLVSPVFLGLKYDKCISLLYKNRMYSIQDIKDACPHKDSFISDLAKKHNVFDEIQREAIYDYVYRGIIDTDFCRNCKTTDVYRLSYMLIQIHKYNNGGYIKIDDRHKCTIHVKLSKSKDLRIYKISDSLYKSVKNYLKDIELCSTKEDAYACIARNIVG